MNTEPVLIRSDGSEKDDDKSDNCKIDKGKVDKEKIDKGNLDEEDVDEEEVDEKKVDEEKADKGRVVVSWTGGKDGCLACYGAILEGFEVTHLLNFREIRRRGSHDINPALLYAQAEALGIPLIHKDFISYEQEFKKAVRNLRNNGEKIDGAVFGHIETHRKLVDRICGELCLELIMPLWQKNSRQIINSLIDSGFEVILISVKADLLGKEWLGRKIDENFICDLKKHNPSIDPCGENGEFHTFVTNCPLFKNKINVTESEMVLRGGYWFLEISKLEAGKK
ncbi:Dph6-related ATP pyrophosphatase [Methanosarcina mazei]|uniref:ATP-binding protein n=2 Tax=Methanosarcina mazei TaxID=2209 RepID=A0A0F8R7C5_METMZ|nr:diphthine--ammonia ligase [Methanosarcina mazei]KKG00300.1 ATP-binding protein [Methanosarcina mazei]KKG08450.1 ATP-binding protein [Methanosarcina mazei]KKG87362.1 ATP-binding protein [Methanosarcina mazei]KKH41997.1 ATP-binding protein [Methanosarcina mazei]KKH44243.1 ATP-binding protein [Methanosarcina mazei]